MSPILTKNFLFLSSSLIVFLVLVFFAPLETVWILRFAIAVVGLCLGYVFARLTAIVKPDVKTDPAALGSSERLNYLSRLDQFKNKLLSMNLTERISSHITGFIKEFYEVTEAKIYLWDENQGSFIPHPITDSNLKGFYVYDPYILWITDHDGIYHKNDFIEDTDLFDIQNQAIAFYNLTQAELTVPLILNNSLIGMLVLSGRRRGRPFTELDRERLLEIRSVAVMSLSNAIFYEKLSQLTENLEVKVKERTKELEEAQSQLVMSEKMASLGVMVAGIAHEINTPAGVINGSADNLEMNMDYVVTSFRKLDSYMKTPRVIRSFRYLLFSILKTEDANIKSGSADKFRLKKELRQYFVSRKIPDNLSSDAANFLADRGLSDKKEYLAMVLENGGKELFDLLKNMSGVSRNLKNIKYAIKNIVRIVKALKYYSHLDQASHAEADLSEGIENTMIILHNQIKHGINVHKEFKDIGTVPCNIDELNQVWTNIIQNAIQAMKGSGDLTLRIFSEDSFAIVEVEDTGPGIPAEIIDRIWDPFFTTKDQGEGSGLGLGIVKGIIEKHKGKISANSKPGKTVFRIALPMVGNQSQQESNAN